MIDLPTTKLPATATPSFVDNGGTMRSATNSKGLRLNRLGSHFRIAVTMPLHDSEDAAPLIADLIAAKQEGLRMFYPLQGVDQSGSGSPVMDGGAQAGRSIKLRGLTPGYRVKKGFWLSIVNAGGQHFFHNVRAGATAGGDGKVTIEVRPMMNYAFVDGASVRLDAPMIEGEISGNEVSWQIVRGDRVVGLAFTVEETL